MRLSPEPVEGLNAGKEDFFSHNAYILAQKPENQKALFNMSF
jgi:hypothetical protein